MEDTPQVQSGEEDTQARNKQLIKELLGNELLQEAMEERLELVRAQIYNMAINPEEGIRANDENLSLNFAFLRGQVSILEELINGGK